MAGQYPTFGSLIGIWRYPVKSMGGEELDMSDLTARGLVGDRAYALIDAETNKVVSAKNPRKWGNMFDFRASFTQPVQDAAALPPARIVFPDGATAATDDRDVERLLSQQVGRSVRLAVAVPESPRLEGYWPDYDWLESPDGVFEVELPPGTFFDCAVIHVLTTATLGLLASLVPQSRVDTRRFRPNLILELSEQAEGFVENDWVGRTLKIGSDVRLSITGPCSRCVMTTLSQGDLPKDPGILRAIVQHNHDNFGALASVMQGGRVRRGDAVIVD
jgi:uncharacterized protein YcbX